LGDGLSERAEPSSPDAEPETRKPSFRERLSVSLRLVATALRNRRIRAVLLAFVLFSIAEWARWVALLVYGFDRAGPTGSGLMSVLQLAPAAAITPFTSSLADRYPRARVLMLAYLVSGVGDLAAAAALRAGAPFLVVAAFALVGTTGILMIRPTMSSLMPSLASTPDELTAANVSSTFIVGGSLFVGPLIAAGTLLLAGPAAILVITGAGLALGGLLLLRIPAEPIADDAGDARVAVLGGFRELGRDRGGGLIVGLMALQAATWGMVDVLIVTLAIRTLDLGQSGAGLLSGVMGIGGLLGGAFAVVLVGRSRLSPAFALGVALWSLPLIVIGLLLAPVPTLLMLAVSGAGFSLLDVSGRTLLQRLIPDEMLGRVFGVLESGFMAAWGVGSLVAPVSLRFLGTRWTLAVAGCLLPVASALSWRTLTSVDKEAPLPGPELDLLRGIEMFALLRQAVLEQMARHLEPVTRRAGEVIIREGDHGDLFYVVSDGTVRIDAGGKEIARVGPGGYFGEIALLRDVPRTASVTAETDVRLLSLDRVPFLRAVTGSESSVTTANAEIDRRLGSPPPDEER
jgi:MFS family permease